MYPPRSGKKSSRQRVSCYRKALDLLAKRSHFEREMARKLNQRQYSEIEIEETLERLRGEGLLDEGQTAREFIRSRLARAPEGRMKLRAELGKRGVAGDIIDEALAELTPDDDRELASQAAERWMRSRWRPGRDVERQRASLARHLASRGFSRGAVYSALEEATAAAVAAED